MVVGLQPGRCTAAAVLAALCSQASAETAQKPHILLLLADDYGHANMGYNVKDYGDKQLIAEAQTPVLDGLIKEGVHLRRHYSYAICAPSRASLQTGRLGTHVNMRNTGVNVYNASDPEAGAAGIPTMMTGIAEKMKSAGYRTHGIGKWDAGMATPERTPIGKGYETWFGYYQHANDYWTKGSAFQATGEIDNCLSLFTDISMKNATYSGGVFDQKILRPDCKEDDGPNPPCYEEVAFKERAKEIIMAHDLKEPLFMFYSSHLLHTPLQVPKWWLKRIDELVEKAGGMPIDTQNRRLYAAMTHFLDQAIGEIVDTLKSRGMYENTLIAFMSDNGGPIYEPGSANNWPLKGGKYTQWEGGVRVNAFMSGGLVPKENRGTAWDGIMSIADWYATFCELAGISPEDTKAESVNKKRVSAGLQPLPPVDSKSVWKEILSNGKGRGSSPLHMSDQAVLAYPWKLVVGKLPYSKWTGPQYPNCTTWDAAFKGHGPVFVDVKVFDESIVTTKDPVKRAEISWEGDCGEAGCLFNVEEDPSEHNNLAADPKYADKLKEMHGILAKENAGIFQPYRGEMTVAACDMFIEQGGYLGPFMHAEDFYKGAKPDPPAVGHLAMKKRLIHILNKPVVVECIQSFSQAVVPRVWPKFNQGLDKCISKPTPEEASENAFMTLEESIVVDAFQMPGNPKAMERFVRAALANCGLGHELPLDLVFGEPVELAEPEVIAV
eukprot:TRINITY_DN3171_c0_g1_i1.p1 TRINITY_DN3171_c0_g1~~TRINITY_DN3171_c0_g1_i1.p1  ORF type:complete len:758 (+),score=208.06 TRINITY_DN3171_c0_g1_i1:112-2274(+)